jgi:pilus assembly protein Flp/PilA
MRFARTVRQTAQWLVGRLNIRSERGATAVEYGLMVALIAAVIILAVFFLGKETSKIFSCTAEEIANKSKPCP